MKSIMALLIAFSAVSANALEVIDFAPKAVFSPQGFDSNDHAQVVVDGLFPSTCYKVGETKFSVDKTNKVITIRDQAIYFKGAMCLFMQVPYSKVVNLGVLEEGNYKVMVEEKGFAKLAANLPVKKSKVDVADDYLYAPVEEISIDASRAVPVLTIKGHFVKDCLSVSEVRVNMDATNRVIEVLPIVTQSSGSCSDSETHFEEKVELVGMPQGRALVHVRALNGQALNRVVTF